ncbi:MAG TPA: hypothetical protein VMT88_04595 [Actinomycetes bacterium]|nr:hypothetical protein [Actinomycetes bacterium]
MSTATRWLAVVLTVCGLGVGAVVWTMAEESRALSPVPISVWQPISGVQVTSTVAHPGTDCCESRSADRELWLAVAGAQGQEALHLVSSGMVAHGWQPTECLPKFHEVCLARDGYFAKVHDAGTSDKDRANVLVTIERQP